ncbi:Glycosyl transferase family group 2 [Pseudonocardia thermophila]|uniref:Glycosyl transferase family group 2 n=1 Tax=Pseudonocardia thermophila TaxID=1848 RepID=A0A1M6YWZ6_PSETH|nr:glycosyltransferase family 2 protein [Pseudonocardia thermophila]SHL22559.1 Glycosyl transferase family group 2 [Pseudonocardia thermophila]
MTDPSDPSGAARTTTEADAGPGVGESDLVTVIMPARDEEKFIGAALDGIQAQDYRNLQIVVVVDGATRDRTTEVVEERAAADPRIELLHNPQGGIPRALNIALAAARGRWLVRVDAHSTVGTDYVRKNVSRLQEGRWGGVGGRKDGHGVTPAGRAIAAALGSPFGVGGSVYHHGEVEQEVDHVPFGAYPVALLRELGGWDEDLVANEDYEFDYRLRMAGHRLLFDPDIKIRWHSRQTIGDLYKQYRRYGHGKVAVALKHPASMRPRHVLVPAFLAWLVLAGLVALRRPRIAAAMVAPYAAALTAASVKTGRDLPRESRKYVAPAFLAMHIGWGVGFWAGVADALRRAVSRSDDRRAA